MLGRPVANTDEDDVCDGRCSGTELTPPDTRGGSADFKVHDEKPYGSGGKADVSGNTSRQAPGARADTVHVDLLWNSQLRWLLKSRCGRLRTFIFSSFQSRSRKVNVPCTSRPVWPLPLLVLKQSASEFPMHEQRCLQNMILVMNWLALGQPGKVPSDYCGSAPMSGEQRGIVARLRSLIQEWVQQPPVTSEDMGRTAGKIETLQDSVKLLTAQAGKLLPKTGSGTGQCPTTLGADGRSTSLLREVQAAKEIEADRLQFSGKPVFNPAPFLTEASRQLYERPLDLAVPEAECLQTPPRVKVRGRRSEVMKLLKALDDTDRLAVFPEAEVRSRRFHAGLFCLMKNSSSDRLILDARPSNLLEEGQVQWTQTMGSITGLLDWRLEDGFNVISAGEDLKDYYYFYAVTRQRSARNALGFVLQESEAKELKAYKQTAKGAGRYVAALATMAMGDLNSVEFGQQAHVRLALSGGLRLTDLLTLRSLPPRLGRKWLVGIIIDDFICIEQVPRAVTSELASSEIADSMVALYEQVGLASNSKKRFRGETSAKFWGASLEGERGTVRAQLERVLPVSSLTSAVCRLGAADRKLLEILAGTWTSILQCRKRCMCLLGEVFTEIQLHEYGETFNLRAETIAELWSITLLAPLYVTDLRAGMDEELSLVDASDAWMAETYAKLPKDFAYELGRHKLTKAAWARMLSPWKALQKVHGILPPEAEVPEGEQPAKQHFLWSTLAKTLQFSLRWRRKVKRRQHINISELSAALEAERLHGQRCPNCRFLLGSDSQVVLGALVKGRSSSKRLNEELKRSLPYLLGSGTYTYPQYIHTADNVADDPTRDRDCRTPSEPVPQWLQTAFDGDYTGLDAELTNAGLSAAELARLPEDDQPIAAPVSRIPDRELRRRAWHSSKKRTGVKEVLSKSTGCSRRRFSPWIPKTELAAEATAFLKSLPRGQFVLPTGVSAEQAFKYAGHLDLFSGAKGAAKALVQTTGRWVLTFDILHSPTEDLLATGAQRMIQRLLGLDCLLSITAGPVCSSFSRAVRPPVRSRLFPRGLAGITPAMAEKVDVGNNLSQWLAGVIEQALDKKIVVWVENPSLSYIWSQPEWVKLAARGDTGTFLTDYCRWGTAWRKRTAFFGNFSAINDKLLCCCGAGHKHLRLVGYSATHKKSWTKVAEPYPTGLCRYLAIAVAESLKAPDRQRKLDAASCARSTCKRVGEAKNPGPRPRGSQHRPDLDTVETVRAATRLIQTKIYKRFHDWLAAELTAESFESLALAPHLELVFLKLYGLHLYNRGEPMYLFRHLVVFLQQSYPAFKHMTASSWEILSKWEIVQPVSHRAPTPKVLVDAMLSLACSWNWWRWAGVTAVSFHGAMRIGEPLAGRRQDLLFPDEAGIPLPDIFVRVGAPKPGRRGRGRVQHTRISDPTAISVISRAFKELDRDEQLYPGSAASYRRRWNSILAALDISPSYGLTPGGLRGGGSIHLYHLGVPITDILWRMRLRQLVTLESYLQETAGENIFLSLPLSSRKAVKSCAAMLPFLLHTMPAP